MRAAFAGVLLGLVVAAHAQPAPEPDLARAKDLYLAAESAMTDGRYADAIRDYGGTFDITHDPILFYKIGAAHEKAGKCDVALIYYGRYVKEARPTDRYLELTKERVRACGGDDRIIVSPRPPDPIPEPIKAVAPVTPVEPVPEPVPEPVKPVTAAPVGSKAASMTGRDRGAWLLIASSIGFVTVGAVLAYSADSAESDISDLYQGFTGTPASFDEKTQATYDDLVDEGRRYERLSWLSFGLAGATAITAIVLFKTGKAEHVQVAPTVSPEGGGVSASVRW